MLILGIDPGSRFCGYGLLQFEGRKVIAAGCDVIDVSQTKDLPERLKQLHERMIGVIHEYRPDMAAVETMFFSKQVKSIFTLGHARGVLLLSLAQCNIPMFEYSPREIKKAVVGNGNATKQQVRFMVNSLFKLKNNPTKDDAYDALAIAVCHFNRMRISGC
ncbi:MAG TPA: crossover junction endodeoxyribonuclease RuvC [Candidatus Cloacimonadota bacterium]|nr:crossover junction endodeoxyribonuclease RuvC [Candidatus Cloacimonadota bacterium]HPS37797.1 crossover junction endodeoxyribonuclease RuvC [Candidatus Cloacimonadota bacterium]